MGQSGRDVKLQSNQKKEGGMEGATLFEPPDFAALSQPRNVGVRESAPPVKTGPDAFSPAASSQPVCRSQYHRRQDRLLRLKLRRQARLNGATDRGQGGAGGAPTWSISAPARGARAESATRLLSKHPRVCAGVVGTRSSSHEHCLEYNCLKESPRQKPDVELWFTRGGCGLGPRIT